MEKPYRSEERNLPLVIVCFLQGDFLEVVIRKARQIDLRPPRDDERVALLRNIAQLFMLTLKNINLFPYAMGVQTI